MKLSEEIKEEIKTSGFFSIGEMLAKSIGYLEQLEKDNDELIEALIECQKYIQSEIEKQQGVACENELGLNEYVKCLIEKHKGMTWEEINNGTLS